MPTSLDVRANDIDIHFFREGRGPPLVLLHGWPEFCDVWEPVISALYWGEDDPVLKAEWMDRLPESFANMRASVAEGLGHFVHYESPERAAQEIARFFELLMM